MTIVTGSSKGIGAAIAKHLRSTGAAVVVNHLSSKQGADSVINEIVNKGGKAISVEADVRKEADIQRLFTAAKNVYGRLDILVNNVGVYEFRSIENITVEHYHKHFDVNAFGFLHCYREAVKYFDHATNGTMINIVSNASTSPAPQLSICSATKSAVDAMTKALSKEMRPRKVRANSISSGLVETKGIHAAEVIGSSFHMQAIVQTPSSRIGQPDDIARVSVFFASDDSAWITDESLRASGGSSYLLLAFEKPPCLF